MPPRATLELTPEQEGVLLRLHQGGGQALRTDVLGPGPAKDIKPVADAVETLLKKQVIRNKGSVYGAMLELTAVGKAKVQALVAHQKWKGGK